MSGSRAWIAVGSNLGDRAAFLAGARLQLQTAAGITRLIAGVVEETAPLGGLDQPAYLNQMIAVDTTLAPQQLLDLCHAIERNAGRTRPARWCSRTLDLDLVRYDGLTCDLPALSIPHPGLRDRTFWATQIAELERNV